MFLLKLMVPNCLEILYKIMNCCIIISKVSVSGNVELNKYHLTIITWISELSFGFFFHFLT